MQELFMSWFGWADWEYGLFLDNLVSGLLNGLVMGGTLFVIASGFTLVFGLMRIVNMAHGALLLWGAFLGTSVQKYLLSWLDLPTNHWLSWVLAILLAAAFIGLTTLVLQVTLLRWVQGNEARETLLTLGVATIIGNLLIQNWSYGKHTLTLYRPASFDGSVMYIGERYVGIATAKFYILAIAICVGVALWLLMNRTQLGRIIRAGVDNRSMVSAMGIDIGKLFLIVFFLAGAITGLGGVLGTTQGMDYQPSSGLDMEMLTYSLIVVIIGGMGSLPGAALGALLVGLVYSLSSAFIPVYASVILFGVLILVLVLRPQGLLGKKTTS